MTILLPLVVAALQWTLLPGSLWIGYPSGVKVEQVCADAICFTPTNTVMDVIPWDGGDHPEVSVQVIHANGQSEWQTAVRYPVFQG